MRAEDLMTEGVVTVPAAASADEAWKSMQRHGIHHLVVKATSKTVGVVSARDISGRAGDSLRKGRTVADFMATSVATVDRKATVRTIANLMRGRSVGSIVVTSNGRTVGIITVTDLLELIGRGVGSSVKADRPGLHYRAAHRKRSLPSGVW
jgi:CBS domain-containing protein